MKHLYFTFIIFCTSFVLYAQDATPMLVDIKGMVVDGEDKPRAGEQILFENITNQKVVKAISDEKGAFITKLVSNNTYLIKIKQIGKDIEYQKFEIPQIAEGVENASYELTLKYSKAKTYTLNNVHFLPGKSTLTTASYEELKDLLEYMTLKKTTEIEVAGHTDDVGDEEQNLILSQKRAVSVRAYLVKNGIDGSRITAKGYGESRPVDTNETPEGRKNNRRCEVNILKE